MERQSRVGTVTAHQRDRFEAKIRRYDDPRRCWLWTGAKSSTGYGNFVVADNRTQPAHRVAFQLFVGRIPAGRVVLHRCHRRLCMNPRHLYLRKPRHQDSGHGTTAAGRHAKSEPEGHPSD